jgi:hypothetical protein
MKTWERYAFHVYCGSYELLLNAAGGATKGMSVPGRHEAGSAAGDSAGASVGDNNELEMLC